MTEHTKAERIVKAVAGNPRVRELVEQVAKAAGDDDIAAGVLADTLVPWVGVQKSGLLKAKRPTAARRGGALPMRHGGNTLPALLRL